MCNCNSSFCAVCCRRVKAYRFDNVPEITGDLQLYTEFYKVGEAYGHWKFTIDDLEAYLDIPTVLWNDKRVAFGHTATGGLFYQSDFRFDYTTSSLTIGTSIALSGSYNFASGFTLSGNTNSSLLVGGQITANGGSHLAVGTNIVIEGSANFAFGANHSLTGSIASSATFGFNNTLTGAYLNFLFGAELNDGGFLGNTMFSDLTGGSTAIADDSFTAQFAGGYRFRLDASSTAVNISSTGIVTIDNVVNNNTENQLLVWNVSTKEVEYRDVSSLPGGGGGSVTSVDAAFLNGTALTVVGGAITTAGTFDFEWQGLNTDYVAGDGSIIAFPTLTSGTVTSVSAGNGMTFTTITTSGAVTLGTPSSITLASTNSVGVGTHSHLFAPGGTTAQYIRGDGTLATTPLGSVTSVGMTITAATALSVAGSPITTVGTLAFSWTGTTAQYVRGDGSLATFPTIVTYTAGTGIDITGGVITNTLPSLWKRTGTLLSPLTANDTVKIGTTNTGIQTLLTLENTSADVNRAVRIDLGAGGIIQSYPDAANSFIQFLGGTNGVRFGTIAYGNIFYAIDTGSYALLYTNQYSDTRLAVHRGTADTALHVGGEVKIDTINNYASATQILVNNGNVISYATKADLGIPTVTPSAISKIDDTNVTLTLGGGYATALLQATSLTIGWTGNLSVSRGGSGAGTFTAGYLKANGTTAFTTVATIPYTDISGTPTIPTQYWQRSAAVLSPLNLYDSLYLSGATGSVNTLLQLDYLSSSASNGARIDFTLSGSTVNGYVSNEVNGTLFFTNVYGIDGVSLQTKTGGVTSDVLIARANKTVYINTIPNFAGGTDFLVNNSGTISYRTISSFGTVTSIASGNGMNFSTITSTGTITMGMPSSISLVSTNSTSTTSHTHAFVPGGTSSQVILGNGGFGSYIPGLWQRSGSEIRPLNANDTVRITTTSTGVQTLLTLANTSADVNRAVRIDLGAGGIIQSYPDAANSFIQFLGGTNGVRFGTIAGGTFMSLTDNGSYVLLNTSQFVDTRLAVHRGTADEALHVGGKVKIDTISTVSSSTNLLTTNGGVLETRTIASLTGLTTDVFKIQGGTTNASAITDDIYHNGKLKLGTSTSSAYQLSVSGTGYFTSTVDFNNNVGIQGFTTGAVIKNIAKINGSNLLEIGVSGTDITLPAYTSARGTDTRAGNDKYLFVNASGVVKLDSDENIRNIIGWISKTTNTTVTSGAGPTKISGSSVQQTAGGAYTITSGNLTIPAADRYHLITVTVQFVTSSGTAATPNITFDVYNGAGVVQDSDYIVNHSVINDTVEYSFVLQGVSGSPTTIYVRATATVSGITVQKCHMKAMEMGPV